MKKWMTAALFMLLVLGLCACGKKEEPVDYTNRIDGNMTYVFERPYSLPDGVDVEVVIVKKHDNELGYQITNTFYYRQQTPELDRKGRVIGGQDADFLRGDVFYALDEGKSAREFAAVVKKQTTFTDVQVQGEHAVFVGDKQWKYYGALSCGEALEDLKGDAANFESVEVHFSEAAREVWVRK